MNYARYFRNASLGVACLLIVACGEKSGNSPSRVTASALPPSASPNAKSQAALPADTPLADTLQNDSSAVSPPPNSPPTISGTAPAQATVGQLWTFQPTVSDPDGDQLNLTASNLPAWISLNDASGVLSGTPGDADIQTWADITLTVSDGNTTANLAAFTVNVLAPNAATGSATLSWFPPTERLDGSPLGEFSGYRVLYGPISGQYTEIIPINNPGITSYVIEGLTSGDWYFAIQTVDAAGTLSPLSAEGHKTI